MNDRPTTEYEVPGIALLFVAGAVAVLVSAAETPVLGELGTGWLFVGFVAVVVGWARLTGPSAIESPHEEPGDGAVEGTAVVDDSNESEGHILDVALLDWANGLVGTTCARCDEEISYANLRSTEGGSDHRVSCGCTRIEAGSLD